MSNRRSSDTPKPPPRDFTGRLYRLAELARAGAFRQDYFEPLPKPRPVQRPRPVLRVIEGGLSRYAQETQLS